MEASAMVYDMDPSGGLMEKIKTLLAPPKSEDDEEKENPQKETERGSRSTKQGTCEACKEGGDLQRCDRCSAAFHLQCCNPPLSEEMLPDGKWVCHRCAARTKAEPVNGGLQRPLSKRPSLSSSELDALRLRSTSPAAAGDLQASNAQVHLLDRRASGTPTSNVSTDTPTPSEQNDVDEDLLDAEDDTPGSESDSAPPCLKRPFQLLVAAAMERHPTQFQLPREFTSTSLTGSSKRRRIEEASEWTVRRPQLELDRSGLVPLPARVCFACNRGCRMAPLIQCDFCPLLFHLDCVEPPLSTMPTGKWMCPKHTEYPADQMTFSNRCQLVDQFQDHTCQHALKVDLLRWVQQRTSPDIHGDRPIRKKTVKVPDFIKCQYRRPPAILEPAGIRRGELICQGSPDRRRHPPHQRSASEAEQQQWLHSVVALQCSVLRHFSAKQRPPSFWDREQTEKPGEGPGVASSLRCCRPSGTHAGPRGPEPERSSSTSERRSESCQAPCGLLVRCVKSDLEVKPARPSPPEPAADVKTEDSSPVARLQRETPSAASRPHGTGTTTGGQIVGVSSPVPGASALTLARESQDSTSGSLLSPLSPSDGKTSPGAVSPQSGTVLLGSRSSSIVELSDSLKRAIEGNGDPELSKQDEDLVKMLALQRIQQIMSSGLPQATSTSGRRPLTPDPGSLPLSNPKAFKKDVQARATFYPITGGGSAVSMRYRTLYIGTDTDMDVCLAKYGHCDYISAKHACIFYDENTKHYELLNYSEHGTTVDNVLYSCDFSVKPNPGPPGGKVQGVNRRCRKRKPQQQDAETVVLPAGGVMSSAPRGEPSSASCNCKASSSSLIGGSGAGWEGTALLHHGSYVKLGCLQFVFSVGKKSAKQPKEEEPVGPS
ncbi:PHD finger protein 12 isoform X2 [Denticeps clupeoides]|uniref:PHD finger protein 12 n=1 Tax=Denticeps clupeoides TaxID=299321 RepID=A0AAY4DTM9_9TELE|nr:PHD finger protein 12-like isoform X2 [Denticeps clupeoides]